MTITGYARKGNVSVFGLKRVWSMRSPYFSAYWDISRGELAVVRKEGGVSSVIRVVPEYIGTARVCVGCPGSGGWMPASYDRPNDVARVPGIISGVTIEDDGTIHWTEFPVWEYQGYGGTTTSVFCPNYVVAACSNIFSSRGTSTGGTSGDDLVGSGCVGGGAYHTCEVKLGKYDGSVSSSSVYYSVGVGSTNRTVGFMPPAAEGRVVDGEYVSLWSLLFSPLDTLGVGMVGSAYIVVNDEKMYFPHRELSFVPRGNYSFKDWFESSVSVENSCESNPFKSSS
jgi:hypothetical protein